MADIMITAILPWYSPDAATEFRVATYDSQDLIDMCLSCHRSKCSNCIGSSPESACRSKQATLAELKELLDLHKRSPEICAALKISARTLTRYKNELRVAETFV